MMDLFDNVKPEAEHRAMPERTKRRMTNRELAKWVAQGKGEVWAVVWPDPIHRIYTQYVYGHGHGEDSEPCGNGVKIRGWDETEWHEPEVEG